MALFDDVGGAPAIDAAVDLFYAKMTRDATVARWFDGVDLETLKSHQRAFLAVGLGGPEEYDGRSMRIAHDGLGITPEAYTVTVRLLGETLVELGVDAAVIAQIAKRIESMRAAIVEAP